VRKSLAERIREAKRKAGDAIRIGENGEDPAIALAKVMMGGGSGPRDPLPELLPTQQAFLCDPTRVKAYKGPQGCGKTTIALVAGLSKALWEPGSIGVVAQLDYNHLIQSTFQSFQKIVQRLPEGIIIGRDKSPPMRLEINPIGGGEPSQIIFMGLKENLGGYEFNWAFLDEADKIEEQVANLILGRLRYVPQSGVRNYSLMMAFNPPDKTHWLYRACTGKDGQDRKVATPWVKLYEPLKNENKFLETGYYDNLAKGYTRDQRVRLIDGDWGSTFEGSPVYPEFRYEFHAQENVIGKFDKYRPLIRFWDFGYNAPYCGFAQIDWEGRILIMHEIQGEKIEIVPFIQKCKAETARLFPHAEEFEDYGDPAVAQKKDTGQALALMYKAGIQLRFKRQHIDPGVRSTRLLLERVIRGEPAFQIDRRNCPILISAFRGGYHLDKDGLKPVKDGYYDHSADACRYLITNTIGNGTSSSNMKNIPASIEYDAGFDNGDDE
jgi:hypothetical protein